MSLISARDVSKRYGTRTILDSVSMTIEPGDRVGLIGINGAGKSTLLRILLGKEEPDAGIVQRKRGLRATAIGQNPVLDPSATISSIVERGLLEHEDLHRRLEEVGHRLSSARDEDLADLVNEQGQLSESLERSGGWNQTHRAEAVMEALKVPRGERLAGTLSQGEQRRVAIAAALVEAPELLVLDEPTNHLDVEVIEWLEENFVAWPGSLILVTHDRWFLDRVANRHAELDRGDLRLYEGNYSEYLAAKAERDAMEARVEHKRRRSIESELEWVRRRAPARTTKQRARLERFDALVAARPKADSGEARFRLPYPPRLGGTILELLGLSKALDGRRLVDNLTLRLKKGDRVGVVGPNGAGKTTLLRMITGEVTPDSGSVIVGQNSKITYADQRRILDDSKSVLEEVAGDNDVVWVGEEAVPVYGFLEGLLFDGVAQRAQVASLSGGERSRVALAKALRVAANVLILDEPTNDLDLPTLRVLEDALVEYPGCALIVSHDRYFLDRVATAILAFEGNGRITLYEGTYDAFRQRQRELPTEQEPESPKVVVERPKVSAKKKRSFKEEREFVGMEERILAAETEVAELEAELSDPAKVRTLGAAVVERIGRLEQRKLDIEGLYRRWAELSELGGGS
ncbi:MAG: ATP-binding cassette domain-containing protein [Deltaproteobacteria bacterium]|nr:ATP-binding cassette domain-containing protein [Deltaproteobacteria bacterium]